MAHRRDPFGLALEALRRDLRDGLADDTTPLNTAHLAERLGVSATPIREALSRLAGEGLLDDRRGRGYFARRYDAADIQDLYRMHGAGLGLAVELSATRHRPAVIDAEIAASPRDSHSYRDGCERLWADMVTAVGNRVLLRAHQTLCDQLAPIRLVEWAALPGAVDDLMELLAARRSPDHGRVRRAMQGYHQRRVGAAAVLAEAFRRRINIVAL